MTTYSEKIKNLYQFCRDDPDTENKIARLKDLEEKINAIPDYYNGVMSIDLLNTNPYRVDSIDDMMQSINDLNDLCEHYGLEKLFDIDHALSSSDSTERDQGLAAAVALDFCKDVFMNDNQKEDIQSFEDIFKVTQTIERRTSARSVMDDVKRIRKEDNLKLSASGNNRGSRRADTDYVNRVENLYQAHKRGLFANTRNRREFQKYDDYFQAIPKFYDAAIKSRGDNSDPSYIYAGVNLVIAVEKINDLCRERGQEPLFDCGENLNPNKEEDRMAAANACFDFCSRFYMNEKQQEIFQDFNDLRMATASVEERTLNDIITEIEKDEQTEAKEREEEQNREMEQMKEGKEELIEQDAVKEKTSLEYLQTISDLYEARERDPLFRDIEPSQDAILFEKVDNLYPYFNAVMSADERTTNIYAIPAISDVVESINYLNGMCERYKMEKMFDVDHKLDAANLDDRILAAKIGTDFCMKVNANERQKETIKSFNDLQDITEHIGRDGFLGDIRSDIERVQHNREMAQEGQRYPIEHRLGDPDYVKKISDLMDVRRQRPTSLNFKDNLAFDQNFVAIGEYYNSILGSADPKNDKACQAAGERLVNAVNAINDECVTYGKDPIFNVGGPLDPTAISSYGIAARECFDFAREFYMSEKQQETFKSFYDMHNVTKPVTPPRDYLYECRREREIARNTSLKEKRVDIDYKQKVTNLCESQKRVNRGEHCLSGIDEGLSKLSKYYNEVIVTKDRNPGDRREDSKELVEMINVLNQACGHFGQDKMFDVDGELNPNSPKDQAIAAKLCFDFCSNMYMNEKQKEVFHDLNDVYRITKPLAPSNDSSRYVFSRARNICRENAFQDSKDENRPLSQILDNLHSQETTRDFAEKVVAFQDAMENSQMDYSAKRFIQKKFNEIPQYYDNKIHGIENAAGDEVDLKKAAEIINKKCKDFGLEPMFDASDWKNLHDTTFAFCSELYMNNAQKAAYPNYESIDKGRATVRENYSVEEIMTDVRNRQTPRSTSQQRTYQEQTKSQSTLDNILHNLEKESRAEQAAAANDRQHYQDNREAAGER